MRDRLIELIEEWYKDAPCECLADHLLKNGVIVPMCKVGDYIYRIGDNGKIYGDWQVTYIQVYEDEILYIDDSNNYFYASDISKTVFLTREEAEKALKGR
jgi:hypothetical protein